MDAFSFPQKTRELRSHHFDSTVWNDFRFRNDDIVIATSGKSGTTWMQQIVGQLIFDGAEDVAVNELSPWVDLRIPEKTGKLAALEAQRHRRFLKTHLPVDALVFSPAAKYIYVGRDGRDVVWSFYNHWAKANDHWYAAINDTPGRVGPPIARCEKDVVSVFREWLDKDGYPLWSFWENVRGWWDIRDRPNVLAVHFNNLKRNLPGQMRRVARFLDIPIDHERWPALVEHCTFDWMKKHAARLSPGAGALFDGGAESFINKGTNGRWRELLTPDDIAAYERRARAELGEECAHWLETGELA